MTLRFLEPLVALSYGSHSPELVDSVRVSGVLNPVQVIKVGGGYRILDGWRRYRVASELGMEVPTREWVFENEPEQIEFSLRANLTHRKFSPLELAALAEYVFMSDYQDAFLSLPYPKQMLKDYRHLSALPEQIALWIHEQNFPWKIFHTLSRFSADAVTQLWDLVFHLQLNQNLLGQIISLVQEILQRDQIQLSALLEFLKIETISDGKALRAALMLRRYPGWQGKEASFQNAVTSLQLPSHLRLNHDPYFEHGILKLEAEFTSPQQVENLVHLLQNKGWADLFKKV